MATSPTDLATSEAAKANGFEALIENALAKLDSFNGHEVTVPYNGEYPSSIVIAELKRRYQEVGWADLSFEHATDQRDDRGSWFTLTA